VRGIDGLPAARQATPQPRTAWDALDPKRPLIDQFDQFAGASPNSSEFLEARLVRVLCAIRDSLQASLDACHGQGG
jgi:hypothetical protein